MRDSVVCQHTDHPVWHILMNETHVQQIGDTVFSVPAILLYIVSFFGCPGYMDFGPGCFDTNAVGSCSVNKATAIIFTQPRRMNNGIS